LFKTFKSFNRYPYLASWRSGQALSSKAAPVQQPALSLAEGFKVQKFNEKSLGGSSNK
jgi:hypothetical protein